MTREEFNNRYIEMTPGRFQSRKSYKFGLGSLTISKDESDYKIKWRTNKCEYDFIESTKGVGFNTFLLTKKNGKSGIITAGGIVILDNIFADVEPDHSYNSPETNYFAVKEDLKDKRYSIYEKSTGRLLLYKRVEMLWGKLHIAGGGELVLSKKLDVYKGTYKGTYKEIFGDLEVSDLVKSLVRFNKFKWIVIKNIFKPMSNEDVIKSLYEDDEHNKEII